MSTQTNNAYVTKSMNGIISYDDGAGGVMEGGVITANELRIDAIQSTNPPNVVSLFTDTTTIINCGSSTSVLNVSNLNVSNINLPSITFTTLNVSNANSSISNSSTSNSSTSNSSTSNSSTSNSSTSNSSTANNGTTNSTTSNASTSNSTTSNASTSNVSTANNETTNTSTINVSTSNGTSMYMDNIYTNNIQNISTANVSLYTGYTGNIFMGDISTNTILIDSKNSKLSSVNDTTIESGGEIYLNSNGNTQICNTGFGGKLILSGNQEIRAKDRSATSYLFTDAFTGGNLTIGNLSSRVDINSDDFNTIANDKLTLSSYDMSLNALGNMYMYGQSVRINEATQRTTYLGYTAISANASRATIQANGRDDLLLGSSVSTGQVYIGGSGTLNASTINASTYNASTFNVTNINASYIATTELYTDYAELGNINVSSNTIGVLSPTATVDLFPTLTTGTLNICTNATTSGAITIGQAAATGSFSVSEGTINVNPKTTLNIANQIGTGTTNICNNNAYAGTLNIAATAHTSSSQNNLNIGSTTSNIFINSRTISLSTADSGIIMGKPILPNYSYDATTGVTPNSAIGYIYRTAAATNTIVMNADTFYNFQNLTLVDIGVYMIAVKVGLYNANTSGTILVYYFDLCVGTTGLGGIQLQEHWGMNYITLNNINSPNFNADEIITFPYVNTTANTIIYTSGKIGRASAGIRYAGASSYIRATRIA